MPGMFYGWPKNVLHQKGIDESIVDINATVKPHFAIVDGIVGMEGDGPIMGTPKNAGVLVIGRNPLSVDATCCRIMGINPSKVRYLSKAENKLGPIRQADIVQRGESIASAHTDFELLEMVHAHRGLRLLLTSLLDERASAKRNQKDAIPEKYAIFQHLPQRCQSYNRDGCGLDYLWPREPYTG